MIDERLRVFGSERAVPDAVRAVRIDNRVRSVEAWAKTPARRDEDVARAALDQHALHLAEKRVAAARPTGRLAARATVRADEQVATRHGTTIPRAR